MPEARDRLAGSENGDSPSVFGIRRGLYLAGRSSGGNGTDLRRSAFDNKENIKPSGSRSRRRFGRPSKSPLPCWYPRTPLRDITAITKAMEKRRIRLQADAEIRLRNQEAMDSPPTPLSLTNLSTQEPSISEQTATTILASLPKESDVFPDSSIPATKTPLKPANHPLDESFPSPTPSLVTNYLDHISVEQKRSDLDELEKFVSATVMKMPAKQAKKPRRNTRVLMSMR